MKLTNLIFLLSDILIRLSKMQIRFYVNIISLIKKNAKCMIRQNWMYWIKVISPYLTFDLTFDPSRMGQYGIFLHKIWHKFQEAITF